MLAVRPILADDLQALYDMSALAKAGLTTLPHNKTILKKRIDESLDARLTVVYFDT